VSPSLNATGVLVRLGSSTYPSIAPGVPTAVISPALSRSGGGWLARQTLSAIGAVRVDPMVMSATVQKSASWARIAWLR
jgi:hypothetical protein